MVLLLLSLALFSVRWQKRTLDMDISDRRIIANQGERELNGGSGGDDVLGSYIPAGRMTGLG